MKSVNCECKNCCMCKEDYSWNPSTCICENRYLKSIVDESIIVLDKIISVTDSISINVTNTIPANVRSTVNKFSR